MHSRAINGYDASLIGRQGVGDVGKYGFGIVNLGDSVDLTTTLPPATLPPTSTDAPVNLLQQAYGSFVGTFAPDGGTIPGCTTYDANSDCTTCASGFTLDGKGGCTSNAQSAPSAPGQTSTTTAVIFLCVALGIVFLVK